MIRVHVCKRVAHRCLIQGESNYERIIKKGLKVFKESYRCMSECCSCDESGEAHQGELMQNNTEETRAHQFQHENHQEI